MVDLSRARPFLVQQARALAVRHAALGIALGTLALYAQVLGFDFIRYDDPNYVMLNPWVARGLTGENLVWSLTAFQVGNWHPLTLLSHMADVALFGMRPGAHHVVNAAIHALNAALVFLLLRAATGRAGASALAAALFAAHPLNVESVAWISQRKTLLSGCFLLLSMLQYVAWTRRGGLLRYGASLLAFAAALASKPMAVTLPILLLLLDAWPLGRCRASGQGPARALFGRVLEKVPYFVLAMLVSAVTLAAQREGGALGTLEHYPLGDRIAKATVAYAWYLVKTIWPTGLSLFYPTTLGPAAVWKVAGSALLLVALTATIALLGRRRPYLAFGWMWYSVALFPVVGLVQFGTQIVADRYAYLPLLGVFVALSCVAADGLRGRPAPVRQAAIGAAAASIMALSIATSLALRPWHDSLSILGRGVEVAPDNPHALTNLGLVLIEEGRLDDGIAHLSKAAGMIPLYRPVHVNLGYAYAKQGRLEEARGHYEEALRLRGDDAKLVMELGRVLTQMERNAEAEARLRQAAELDPGLARAHLLLGTLLHLGGHHDEAQPFLERAATLEPSDARARLVLGLNLEALGRRDEAVRILEEAVRLEPTFERSQRELDRIRTGAGDPESPPAAPAR